MSNLNIPPEQWLAELFEAEFCAECGLDAEYHTAVPFAGNWFARCDHPLPHFGCDNELNKRLANDGQLAP